MRLGQARDAGAQVCLGSLIGCYQTKARTRFDGHVAQGQSGVHGQCADSRTEIFDGKPNATTGSQLANDAERQVLGVDALTELAINPES